MIKVLHVLDIAGVSSILTHYYNKVGKGKADLIYHQKNNISSEISKFYEGKSFSQFRFLLMAGLKKSMKCDIIHIHGAEILIPLFKITGKKIVLHYHGSDINEEKRSNSIKRIICRSMADLIIYNGKKMEVKIKTIKKIRKKYLPNPVDIEHFHPIMQKKIGSVSFVSTNLDKEKTIASIQSISDAEIIDLNLQHIPYENMPEFLSKFETYIDVKIMSWGDILPDLSTTALQALACGCNVYHSGQILKEFPEEHRPDKIIEKLDLFYKEIL